MKLFSTVLSPFFKTAVSVTPLAEWTVLFTTPALEIIAESLDTQDTSTFPPMSEAGNSISLVMIELVKVKYLSFASLTISSSVKDSHIISITSSCVNPALYTRKSEREPPKSTSAAYWDLPIVLLL
ncbi:hypothetical protein D3C71_1604070 [compost metagenome]